MTAVVLTLCEEARFPTDSKVALVLNGTQFSVREGEFLPKDGATPETQTCYLQTTVGFFHVKMAMTEVVQLLTGGQPAQSDQIVAGSIRADSITSNSGVGDVVPNGTGR